MRHLVSACLFAIIFLTNIVNSAWHKKLDGKLDRDIQDVVLRELKFRARIAGEIEISHSLTSRLYWTSGRKNEQRQVPQHHVVTYRRTVGSKLLPCGQQKHYYYAHVLEFKDAQPSDRIILIHLGGPTPKVLNKTNAEEYVKDVLAWGQTEATEEVLATLIAPVKARLEVLLQNMAKTLIKIDEAAMKTGMDKRIREIKLKAVYQATEVKISNGSPPVTVTLVELSKTSCDPRLAEDLYLGVMNIEAAENARFTSFFHAMNTLLGFGVKQYSTQFYMPGDAQSSLCWFNFDELGKYNALNGFSKTWEEPMKRFTDMLKVPAERGHCTKIGVNFNFGDIAPYFVLTTDFDNRQINVVLSAVNHPCEVTAKMYQSQYMSMDAAEK